MIAAEYAPGVPRIRPYPLRRVKVLVHPTDGRAQALVLYQNDRCDPAVPMPPVRNTPSAAYKDALRIHRMTGLPVDGSEVLDFIRGGIDHWEREFERMHVLDWERDNGFGDGPGRGAA